MYFESSTSGIIMSWSSKGHYFACDWWVGSGLVTESGRWTSLINTGC